MYSSEHAKEQEDIVPKLVFINKNYQTFVEKTVIQKFCQQTH